MLRIFRHYVPTTLLMLGLAEGLILLVSVYVGVTVQAVLGPVDGAVMGDATLLLRALVFAGVMLAVMTAMGLYQRDLRDLPLGLLLRLGVSFGVGLLLMAFLWLVMPWALVDAGAFWSALGAAFLGIASCRFLCFQRTESLLRRRVLVLGAGSRAAAIEGLRRRNDRRGIELVGFLPLPDEARAVSAHRVLEARGRLPELVEREAIEEIVVAVDDRRRGLPVDELLDCKLAGATVIDSVTFFERQLGKIMLDELNPGAVIFGEGFSAAAFGSLGKRAFDVVASLGLLLVAAPVMVLTALAIVVESGGRGPVIYRQQRVGLMGRTFEVLKFRSMRVDAERHGARWAAKNDDRVTRVGRIIRKLRIDELPQLWNVLAGEMSFVGPRPERPEFVQKLERELPYYALRHRAKPGITGWAQICYPYGASIEDTREKLQYDLYYVKNYSAFLDLTILVQTVQVILAAKGAR